MYTLHFPQKACPLEAQNAHRLGVCISPSEPPHASTPVGTCPLPSRTMSAVTGKCRLPGPALLHRYKAVAGQVDGLAVGLAKAEAAT
jgi:hypothetical protein